MPKAKYTHMVCLVGENPLPIYLGIKQFAEKNAQVILVHSAETKPQANAIEKQVGIHVNVTMEELADPFEPVPTGAVMSSIAKNYPDSLLNYTGGTKVMSAYALKMWSAHPENVVYLDEGRRLFRFGDGEDVDVDGAPLTIDVLCSLHDVDLDRKTFCPPNSLQDLISILNCASSLPDFPDNIRNDRDAQRWIGLNTGPWSACLSLLTAATMSKWQHVPAIGKVNFFSNNQWLEELVRHLMLGIEAEGDSISTSTTTIATTNTLLQGSQIRRGTFFRIQGQQFESDVMTVVSQTLRYVSVTKSTREKYVKGKSFEAMHRSTQIGGDMARSCVVCLADNLTVPKCRLSVYDSRHDIFGIDDLKEWIAGDGQSLRQFLTK